MFPAGLDVTTRAMVLSLLQNLHAKNSPHIIVGMRAQDPIPDWTTHLAVIHKDGRIHTGSKKDVLNAPSSASLHAGWKATEHATHKPTSKNEEEIIRLSGVSVTYGDRKASLHIRYPAVRV